MANTKDRSSGRKMSDFDRDVKEMFDSVDLNGDKSITVDELAQYLKKVDITLTQKQIKDAVRKLDRNKNGKLEFSEFRKFMLQQSVDYKKVRDQGEHIRATFRMFDRDGNGVIDKAELQQALWNLLGEKFITNDELSEMMKEADQNEDGTIDYEEFVQIWWALKGDQ